MHFRVSKALLIIAGAAGFLSVGILLVVWQKLETAQEFSFPAAPESTLPAAFYAAVDEAEKAARKRDLEAAWQLGRIYHANKFFDEAEPIFWQLLERNEKNAQATYLLADGKFSRGKEEAGLQLLRRVIQLAPEYSYARFRLAEILRKKGRMDEAQPIYEDLKEHDRLRPYVFLSLARESMRRGDQKKALGYLELVLEDFPDFSPARQLMINLTGEAPKTENQDRGGPGRYVQPPDPWIDDQHTFLFDVDQLTVIADRMAVSGKFTSALEILKRADRIQPGYWKTKVVTAFVLLQKGDYEKALQKYEEAVREKPEDSRLRADLAQVHRRMGNPKKAFSVVEAGLEFQPDSFELHNEAAKIHEDLNRPDSSLFHLRKAHQLQPANGAVVRRAAELLYASGDLNSALPWLKKSVDLNPGDSASRAALADVYQQQGDLESAHRLAREALRIEPQNEALRALMSGLSIRYGQELVGRGQTADAIRIWKEAVELDREHLFLNLHLGQILVQEGQHSQARAVFSRLTNNLPGDPFAHLARGDFHATLGEQEKALIFWEKARALAGQLEEPPASLMAALEARLNQ